MTEQKTVGRAGFLGGFLGFVALIELSVVGIGHSRSLQGDANIQYWLVVALVTAIAAVVTAALARATAATRPGEAARRAAVVASAIGLLLFVWETVALGIGVASPIEWVVGLLRG